MKQSSNSRIWDEIVYLLLNHQLKLQPGSEPRRVFIGSVLGQGLG